MLVSTSFSNYYYLKQKNLEPTNPQSCNSLRGGKPTFCITDLWQTGISDVVRLCFEHVMHTA